MKRNGSYTPKEKFLYGFKVNEKEIDEMDLIREDVDYISGGCLDEFEDELIDDIAAMVDEESV